MAKNLSDTGRTARGIWGGLFSHHITSPWALASVSFLLPQQIRAIVNFKNERFAWATVLDDRSCLKSFSWPVRQHILVSMRCCKTSHLVDRKQNGERRDQGSKSPLRTRPIA